MSEPNFLTIDEFIEELNGLLKVYSLNMKFIKAEQRSFAEWYEDFTGLTLVATEYEEQLYGPRRNKNKP